MSVRPIGGEELGQVYAGLTLTRRRVLEYAGVSEEELQELLKAVQIANRAAWSMTYGDELGLEEIRFEDSLKKQPKDKGLFRLLGNLQYNCVSNGGKDFLPEEQRAALTSIRLAVAAVHFENEEVGRA